MAKKAVSKLKTGAGKSMTKAIKMVKSEKTGAYIFKTEILHNEDLDNFFKK